MRTLYCLVLLMLLAGTCLSASCSGQGKASPQPRLIVPGSPQLASPAELKQRTVSSTFPFFRQASDFLPGATALTLPGLALGQHIFQPDLDGGGSGNGPAWAVYGITLADFSGPDEITLDWASAPAASDAYFGVANFSSKRWDWRSAANVSLVTDTINADHISPTEVLYIAVLLTGTDEATLNWVRAGGNIAPLVTFDASVRGGFGSLTSTLVASGVDPEGTPVSFAFDVYGSSSFTDNGPSGIVADVLYDSIGAYHPVVRVTDGDGGMTEESITIGVGWVHSYGQSGYEGLNAATRYVGGALLAAGITNSWTPAFDRALAAAWQPNGNFANGNNFGNATASSEFTRLATNENNFVMLGGFTAEPPDFKTDHFVALVSSTNLVIYQKLIGTAEYETGLDVALDSSANAVVVCGYDNGGEMDLLVLKIDSGGSVVMQKLVTGTGAFLDPQLQLDSAGNIYISALMDRSPDPGRDIVVMQLDPTGVLQWARRLVVPFSAELRGMIADEQSLYVSGSIHAEMPGVTDGAYLACIGHDGSFKWNHRLGLGNPNSSWSRMAIDERNGDLLLCGITFNQGVGDSSLCGLISRYSSSGALLYISAYNQPNINNQFLDIDYDGDGGFFIVGNGEGVTGEFYEPAYTETTDTLAWETISPLVADTAASISNWDGALASNDVPPPVIDSPTGTTDALAMRWFQP